MPKKRDERDLDIPLPPGWEECQDYDGKIFYIDHNTRQTTWINPRDKFTKPSSFSECSGEQLPYGWEQSFDRSIGVFYVNHHTQTNQLEDPRHTALRQEQEHMLSDYLQHAQNDLQATKEIFSVKQERLAIAKEEIEHLNNTLANWKASRTSLNSASSHSSTKYDPDLIKVEVALARSRLSKLKCELQEVKSDMHFKQRGLETLSQVEHKMATQHNQYSVDEAKEIVKKIRLIHRSLSSGEREKMELMQKLAHVRDELMAPKNVGSSPDVSTLSLSAATALHGEPAEKFSTASQTDLSGENAGYENRWGEVLRLRLQYDEARKQVSDLQQQLVKIEDLIKPGQNESDKDRLLLIQEKEQLMRELQGINPKGRSDEEMNGVKDRIHQLESDLHDAVQLSNRQIAERLKLNESKSDILSKLAEATKLTSYLETQLKSLSASTLSVSSGSSRGSLGSLGSLCSSKGSLSSLNLTDIYSQPHLPDIDLPDLHRRVERLLQGHNVSLGGDNSTVSYNNDNVGLISGSNQQLATIMEMPNPADNIVSKARNVMPSNVPMNNNNIMSQYEAMAPPSYHTHIEKQQTTFSNPNLHSSSPNIYAYTSSNQNNMYNSSSQPDLHSGGYYYQPSPHISSMMMNPNISAMTAEYASVAGASLVAQGENSNYAILPPQSNSQLHHMPSLSSSSSVIVSSTSSSTPFLTMPNTTEFHQVNQGAYTLPDISFQQQTHQQLPPPPVYRHPAEQGNINVALQSNITMQQREHFEQTNNPQYVYLPQISQQNHLQKQQQQLQEQNFDMDSNIGLPQNIEYQLKKTIATSMHQHQHEGSVDKISNPPMSPISDGSSGVCNNLSSGGTRSISAAVSNESVGGDSGVYEASMKRSSELDEVFEMSLESAQVQIKLKYDSVETELQIGIEQARNLSALHIPEQCQVFLKTALLPAAQNKVLKTNYSSNLSHPKFCEYYNVKVPENRLASQTLQVHVWCYTERLGEECLGCAQVSLASYNPRYASVDWYNVLSFKFMQADSQTPSNASSLTSLGRSHSNLKSGDKVKQVLEESSKQLKKCEISDERSLSASVDSHKETRTRIQSFEHPFRSAALGSVGASGSLKEESSDESTIISSSETSTLTRSQGPEEMLGHRYDYDEDEESSPEDEDDCTFQVPSFYTENGPLEESDEEDCISPQGTVRLVTVNKETNTELGLGSKSSHQRRGHSPSSAASGRGFIRRSQTFTPTAFREIEEEYKQSSLNRSDSDSAVRTKKGPFTRNTLERRSMRVKRSMVNIPQHRRSHTLTPIELKQMRTSIDLELDLQATQTRLYQQNEELSRLRQLTEVMEKAKTAGGHQEPPSWLTENEQLLQLFTEADRLVAIRDNPVMSQLDERAEKLRRKAMREVEKLRKSQNSSATSSRPLREKMAYLTSPKHTVPIINPDGDSEDETAPREV